MINLLPNDLKVAIKAARTNVVLIRYMAIILVGLAFILSVLYVYLLILQSTMASAESRIEANDIKADIYSATRQQVEGLSTQLTEAKSILDQDTRYSNFLIGLGQVTPPNTILDSLVLDDTHFNGTPFQLKGYAKTDSDAVLLGNQLKAATNLFTSVTIESTTTEGGSTGYPVVLTMNVILNRMGAQ